MISSMDTDSAIELLNSTGKEWRLYHHIYDMFNERYVVEILGNQYAYPGATIAQAAQEAYDAWRKAYDNDVGFDTLVDSAGV